MTKEINIEAFEYNPEPDESGFFMRKEIASEQAQRMIAELKELLRTKKYKIGSGTTAEVHLFVRNASNCMKIISTHETMGTVTHTKGVTDQLWYHPVPTEARFLQDANSLAEGTDVQVPRPYYTLREMIVDDSGDKPHSFELSVLAMEYLNAVTLDSIVFRGENNFPPSFNNDIFFKKLHYFIKKLHSKGLYHRDLHASNILVDLKTGLPCVIDFGRATYADLESAYFQEIRATEKGRTILTKMTFPTDEDRLNTLENSVSNFLQWKNESIKVDAIK